MVKTGAGIAMESVDSNLHKNPIGPSYPLSASEINSKSEVW